MWLIVTLLACHPHQFDGLSEADDSEADGGLCGVYPTRLSFAEPDELLDPAPQSASFPTGSALLAPLPGSDGLHVAAIEDGGLAVVDGFGVVQSTWEGGRIARVAAVGERVLATMPDARGFQVFESTGSALREVYSVAGCAGPYGIVARQDGSRFYLACSQEDAVVEYDGDTLVELRRWTVPGQPRWLALKPGAPGLYVGSVTGAPTGINLQTGDAMTLATPSITVGTSGTLTGRVTGDPVVSPDRTALAFPMIYVDNAGALVDLASAQAATYYGSVDESALERFNPAVLLLELGGEGRQRAMLLDSTPRSMPTSVAFSQDGEWLAATMGPSNGVFFARVANTANVLGGGGMERFTRWSLINTGLGPSGVAFTGPNSAVAINGIGRSVQRLPVQAAEGASDYQGTVDAGVVESALDVSLSPSVALGRELFHSSVDPRVSDPANAVSCSTCHFAGRNDGLTWRIGPRVVQTPTLATASHTAPYTWYDEVATVADEAMITAVDRLNAFEADDMSAVEDYVATFDVPDIPTRGIETEAVARGREVFHRPEVGCTTCHSGEWYTDGNMHDVSVGARELVATPTLVGVSATAPYFVDGRADTLMRVIEASQNGSMGNTSSLSCDEMVDLEAFLRSL